MLHTQSGTLHIEKKRAAEEKAARIKENDLIGAQYAQNSKRPYETPVQKRKQEISDSAGRKAGVEEDVFAKIERDYEESLIKERENEEKRWEGFGDFFANEESKSTQRQMNKNSLGTQNKTAEESRQSIYKNLATDYGVEEELLDRLEYEAKQKKGKDMFTESVESGVANLNADIIGGLDLILGNTLQSLGWEDNFISEWNEYYQNKAAEKRLDAMTAAEKTGKGASAEWTAKTIMTLTEMFPDVVLSFLTGGTSTALSLGGKSKGIVKYLKNLAKETVKTPSFWFNFEKNLYPEYEYAKQNGATEEEARRSAFLSSLLNSSIEVKGGYQILPKELQSKGYGVKRLNEWVKSSLEEGKEEVVQNVISELVQKGYFDSDKAILSFNKNQNAVLNVPQNAEDFIYSTMLGAALGLPSAINDTVSSGYDLNYFQIKSKEDVKKVKDYLEKIKNDDRIKYENKEAISWGINIISQIDKMIDKNAPISEQAREEVELLNQITSGARKMMADFKTRKILDEKHRDLSFEEEIFDHMKRKGITREEAIKDIYKNSKKTD